MRQIKLFLLAGIIVFAAACNNQPATETTELAVPVSVSNIKLQSIKQFINTTGTAKAVSETVLNSEIAGAYKLLLNPKTGKRCKLGDRVEKGQVIIRLEDKE